MHKSIDALRNSLVVSCQASPGDPLENVDALRRIALASIQGGAAGLRLNAPDCIASVRRDTNIPIIGIKKAYLNGRLRITPDFASAVELAEAGADIIALDCTDRLWPGGDPWQQLLERIQGELHLPVLADIATLEEALAASARGADLIATTLNGYTERTRDVRTFNWDLLAQAVQRAERPVIAEGHISTPAEARRAIAAGAWCVVVGSAISRPAKIAAGFADAIRAGSESGEAIAVDIGGTSIKAGLVGRTGHIRAAVRIPTRAQGGREAIVAATTQAVDQVLLFARQEGVEPVGVGIASAGAIDSVTGKVFAATENLPGWSGFDLRMFAEQQFGLPTRVENDGHAAALAELYFGSGRSFHSLVAITIGTGVGGGIILNRKLIRGLHGFAGTIGHSTIRVNGRPCSCGQSGCLEAYVSAAALGREYRSRAASACDREDDAALALEVSRRASQKDSAALEAYSVLGAYLAEGIANLFNFLDPEVVIVSGGLVEGRPDFITEVEQRVARALHFGDLRRPCVRLSSGGHQAGILGAAAAVFNFQEQAG
jgi:glucokinase-like ROK family protein